MTPTTPLLCFSTSLPAGIPTNIQWAPPGTHEVTGTRGGKPTTMTIKVDRAAADRLQAQLQDLRTKAAANQGDLPYLDFNHDDAEASARVLAFSWGGEDPASGGIRAEVEWTGKGRRALEDKTYRRFSPSLIPNAAGEIIGAPLNMGGLVNKAAFQTITPLVAGAAGDANQERESKMDPQEKLAADLAAAQTQIAALNAKLNDAENGKALQAKDAEIAGLKTQIGELETKLKAAAKTNAETIVKAAVDAHKLPPQNAALHAKWVDLLTVNPDMATMLDEMAPLDAKLGAVTPSGGNKPSGQPLNGKSAEDFTKVFNAKRAEGKDKSQALDIAMAEAPDAYEAWRKAGGQPALN